jgi:DNA-binding MarR family transcriptional regulator
LVERRPARTGRGNHLFLTDEGRRLSCTTVPAQEDLIADRFAALSTTENQQLLTLLRKLDQSLDHPEEE